MRIRRHLCALALPLLALTRPRWPTPRPEPTPAPSVEVARTPAPIHVDGRLDDEAWAFLQPFIDFVQRDPDEGMPATERTELLLAYDDEALYVGARLHDSEPELIEARLSRRDDHSESDRFAIYLDPRGDRRTGVRFEVTAAGVQRDEIIFNDTWTDRSWDALWESEVTVDDRGWSVEMRIPFSELRFLPGDSYAWGVNALRIIQRKNETDWLALVPRGRPASPRAWPPSRASRASDPAPPSSSFPTPRPATERGPVDDGDPFRDGSDLHGSVGLDLRRKVGGSFALDATVNPDFGQVEVDPAVVNLSDFETFYPEKRPFFVQGRQTFDNFGRNGPNNHYGFDAERARPVLHPPHRARPAGRDRRGLRPEPPVHHHPRGGQVHRQDRRRLERGDPRRGDRERVGPVGHRRRTGAGSRSSPSPTTSWPGSSETPTAWATAGSSPP